MRNAASESRDRIINLKWRATNRHSSDLRPPPGDLWGSRGHVTEIANRSAAFFAPRGGITVPRSSPTLIILIAFRKALLHEVITGLSTAKRTWC